MYGGRLPRISKAGCCSSGCPSRRLPAHLGLTEKAANSTSLFQSQHSASSAHHPPYRPLPQTRHHGTRPPSLRAPWRPLASPPLSPPGRTPQSAKLTTCAVAPRSTKRGPRPPYAGRAQERRDTQRPSGHVRHLDEPHLEGGGADEPGRQLPSVEPRTTQTRLTRKYRRATSL